VGSSLYRKELCQVFACAVSCDRDVNEEGGGSDGEGEI